MQLAQQDLSMACTGQFACHLGEEAEPRGEGAEPRGEGAWPWELGAEGQRLSPGFGQLWVVIALCNPGLSLDVRCTLGLTLVPNTDQLLNLPLTLGVCVYVWAGGLALSMPQGLVCIPPAGNTTTVTLASVSPALRPHVGSGASTLYVI